MGMFVQLGNFAEEPTLDGDFQERFASRLVSQTRDAREARCNFIIPGSTIVAAHIAEVPPPPDYRYIAIITTGDDVLPDIPAAMPGEEPALRYPVIRRASSPDRLGRGGTPESAIAIRQLCLIGRRPDMAPDEFMEYYENNHVPLAEKHLTSIAAYARYFVQGVADPEFDVITEICFASAEDHASFMATLGDPAIGEMFARDEEKLFDRSSICLFLVQQVTASRS